MTVGICSVAYGETYHDFLTEWSYAIGNLETKPTMVTVVHDGVPQEIRDKVAKHVRVMWVEDHATKFDIHPQVMVNTAIALTDTDWVIKLDVDDLILPHALNPLRECNADVLNFGYRIGVNDYASQPVTTEQVLERRYNPIGSCSPFRRWLWQRNKFRDMVFDDWGFWYEAAREGATFTHTGRVDYVYRVHDSQITRRHDHAQATSQVLAL